MLLDGNNMIEMLSLPEWDDRVLDMLEEFGEERPKVIDGNTTIFITRKDYGFEMMFDEVASTEKQKENIGQGNLYFNQIILKNDTKIKLPFGIETSDNYEAICKKIGKKADSKNKYVKNRFRWILNDKEKEYFINIVFTDEKLLIIERFSIGL
ncbi:hypothetical protein KO488_00805 [Poseidonibacter lekithochrous]|uniref:hypothetical protein n=1 Tax=Poseidonibacter TaxID=2321187 RepID=UPI001C0A438D|nr:MULTISPECIES: hypothetical protein [Poseidonibacter]MBU3013275.1 hypothetical protein [Poseidonibacter lekithochrous]MDO6826572.1 hypothetical protein [Poseidonibacter sp. 1_MG-2023]